jgi:uncharacterized phage infection (PIP) family protein YhgE
MVEIKDGIGKIEEGKNVVRDLKKSVDGVKRGLDKGMKTAASPFTDGMKKIDAAARKAEQPFKMLDAKQKAAKAAVDGTKKKTEAMKKIYTVKDASYKSSKGSVDSALKKSNSRADQTKQRVEQKQRDFQKRGAELKNLIEELKKKIAKAKGEIPSTPKTGG